MFFSYIKSLRCKCVTLSNIFLGKKIYLNESATLDRDMIPKYEIVIACTDGTDTSETYLRIELTKDQSDSEAPPGIVILNVEQLFNFVNIFALCHFL